MPTPKQYLSNLVADEQTTKRVRMCIEKAMERAGNGWSLLSPDLRAGLVAVEFMGLMAGQAECTSTTMANLVKVADALLQIEY